MEGIFKGTLAFFGLSVTYLFGGWTILLETLVVFMILDFVTGLLAAGVQKKLNSAIGFKGIAKKAMIPVIVAIGHFIDQAIGNNGDLFMSMVIYFYIANELLSIIENSGKIGLPIPNVIKDAVEVLKSKSQRKGDK